MFSVYPGKFIKPDRAVPSSAGHSVQTLSAGDPIAIGILGRSTQSGGFAVALTF
jgi:hypothetical protein